MDSCEVRQWTYTEYGRVCFNKHSAPDLIGQRLKYGGVLTKIVNRAGICCGEPRHFRLWRGGGGPFLLLEQVREVNSVSVSAHASLHKKLAAGLIPTRPYFTDFCDDIAPCIS